MTLVVGATGQLGTAVVRRLQAAGRPVRAFVRHGANHGHLAVELAFGDLRDPPASMRPAAARRSWSRPPTPSCLTRVHARCGRPGRGRGHPAAGNAIHELGGPEIMSWDEAVGVFADVLGRTSRTIRTPAPMYRAQQLALSPISPAPSNLMGLSWINARYGTPYETTSTGRLFAVEPTSLAEFLARRARATTAGR